MWSLNKLKLQLWALRVGYLITALWFWQVVLSTHAIGGISAQDLILAARIDALPVEYSPKWYQKQQEQR